MKPPAYLFVLLSFLCSSFALADELSQQRQWLSLSAQTQNLHHQLSRFDRDTNIDPSLYDADLKTINSTLNKMVSSKELSSRRIKLKPIDEVGDKLYQNLQEEVYKLAGKYGFYVASEMCDLGARLRFTIIETDKPLELHLRLPKSELDTFVSRLEVLKLLNN
ncbi:hypothetical protein [Rubritalea tangerina]|uniref:hypothetical protein n=1 Tax=Rubritalea tangerina TaxID=430798 RepID=UPI0036119987